ncbi:MAG: signal recognition particle receptor subunit alpha, partial [bacterium]|nr:signal recognition particle receptor subunit alpha [bacterium]
MLLLLALGLWLKKKGKAVLPAAKPLTLGLEKTRANLLGRLNAIVGHQPAINDALLAELEEILIGGDMGVNTTQKLLRGMKEDVMVSGHSEIHLLKEYLGEEIYKILRAPHEDYEPPQNPHVMMIVGVNGVGKTTTIGKLAHRYREEGNKILLAAADTFRAGAVNQLKAWGDRVEATTLAPQEGSDPAAVAFDAVKAGVARGMDRVIIDTA